MSPSNTLHLPSSVVLRPMYSRQFPAALIDEVWTADCLWCGAGATERQGTLRANGEKSTGMTSTHGRVGSVACSRLHDSCTVSRSRSTPVATGEAPTDRPTDRPAINLGKRQRSGTMTPRCPEQICDRRRARESAIPPLSSTFWPAITTLL